MLYFYKCGCSPNPPLLDNGEFSGILDVDEKCDICRKTIEIGTFDGDWH